MARHVTSVQIEVELHERLNAMRRAASLELRFSENSLGLSPMLALLADHWRDHPPPIEWLRDRVKLYPKRGRPPKAVAGTIVGTRPKNKNLGHEVLERRKPAGAYRYFICKQCNMEFSTWDHPSPPALCPVSNNGVSSLYTPKRWTKIELLRLGFEADEVEWAE